MDNIQRAYIFANGDSEPNINIMNPLQGNDIIIAADGGVQHLQTLGKLPHVVVGDLDSIQPAQLKKLQENKVIILRYPTDKDETDLELALQYAKQLGIKDITILFALGARWDMTIANLLLLCAVEFQDMNIRVIDGLHEITVVRSKMTHRIAGDAGDTVSLIPIGGPAEGVSTYGLEYHLVDETLEFGSPRGVSNVLSGNHASIYLTNGFLLCIHINQISNNE